jgi:hypothetical protein
MAVHPQNGTLEPDGATLVHSARFTHSCKGARERMIGSPRRLQ